MPPPAIESSRPVPSRPISSQPTHLLEVDPASKLHVAGLDPQHLYARCRQVGNSGGESGAPNGGGVTNKSGVLTGCYAKTILVVVTEKSGNVSNELGVPKYLNLQFEPRLCQKNTSLNHYILLFRIAATRSTRGSSAWESVCRGLVVGNTDLGLPFEAVVQQYLLVIVPCVVPETLNMCLVMKALKDKTYLKSAMLIMDLTDP